MSDDVLITPASRKIEFKDSGGNIDAAIALSAGGNLQITSTGTIEIGDISEDIHIGNGTEAVDLVFDYASRIYSVANQDLTIGKGTLGGNNVTIDGATEVILSLAGTTEFKLTDDKITLESVATSGEAPIFELYKNDSGPAVSEAIGTIKFTGENDQDEKVTYAEIQAFIEDETDATENAALQFWLQEMGTPRENLRIASNQITFNNTERNVDVKIKSDDGTTNFFSDASANAVGMGTDSPDAKLRIHQTDGSVHGLKVSRNDSSTSTPLVFLLDDSIYVDNPTLHVRNDRADQYGYAALLEGRVGIGLSGNMVTQPDQVLHVEGSILVDAYNNGKTTLASNYSDGDTSLVLTDASTFNEKGTGTIDGVKFSWTARSDNTLTVPDLDANYSSGVTVAADTGLFFREGFETDKQPGITIYDESNSGVSRDDLSINANSAIRMQLGGNAELKLTDDTLSLTPGNQDTGGFTFRGRSDLGMYEGGYFCAIKAPESIFMMIDSNNNDTTEAFIVQKDGSGMGSGTELFRVGEDGNVIIRQAIANPTFLVHADTDSSPAPRIEMMRGAHDTWGTGDNYNDWRIENINHMRFYSGTSSVSSGAAVERFEILSDGSGITINNAFVIPGSAGTSGQVLKWPSSGTTLEWADESGGGGGMTSFQLEDGDGTEVTISDGKEVKFVEGDGMDINWTDTSPGSNADPYDLTFSVKPQDFLSNGANNRVVTATGTDAMNAEANLHFNGTGLGIGTSAIPHGSTGYAKLAIEGTNGNAAGPHFQTTTASDDYPLVQLLSWQHDNIALNFDSYYDGSWRSSDAGSNFQMYKQSDTWKFRYDSGIAAGSIVTWETAFSINTSGQFTASKYEVLTATVGLILTAAQSGAKVVWTGGTVTLPADPPVGSHYQVFNLTNSDMAITYGAGDGTHDDLGSGAVPDVKRQGSLNFVYVGNNDWIYTK